MKIMIIDDDIYFSKKLYNKLLEYFPSSSIKYNTTYDSSINDIYFLDIDMTNKDGFTLYNEIMNIKESIIIFISNKDDFIFTANKLFPYYFLRKRFLDEELPLVTSKIKHELQDQLTFTYHQNNISLDYKDILYFEKKGQYLNIVTVNYVYKLHLTMKEILQNISLKYFGIINQGIIVNFKHIKYEDKNKVILINDSEFYFSRGKQKEFFSCYMNYIASI